MIQVKHIVDSNWLTSNSGYKSLEVRVNEFCNNLMEGQHILDIKYSSVFNSLWANQDDYSPSNGLMQFSVLIMYEDGAIRRHPKQGTEDENQYSL